MNSFKYFVPVFLIYAVFFGWREFGNPRAGIVRLAAAVPEYHRYEIVRIRLETRNRVLLEKWKVSPPEVEVIFNGRKIKSVGGLDGPYMFFDSEQNVWSGLWPCPWNAPAGRYVLKLADYGEDKDLLSEGSFSVISRQPVKVPSNLTVLTYEADPPTEGMKFRGPDGGVKNWKALVDWAAYSGADAFWILAGKTTGSGGNVWNDYDVSVIRAMGRECHRQGILFGVWAMCYMTHPDPGMELTGRYEYARDIKGGRVVTTRAVSLRDGKRPSDIARLLAGYAAMPEVDFLGLDYIRNALGGYELAEDFYKEMPWVRKPDGWEKLTPDEKIAAFARLKISRRDMKIVDAWQWWRAHRVAGIVREIRSGTGALKPIWAFTLGWEKGWQHGQDCVMMLDAGVDIDAIMLYEADKSQFASMMHDWPSYIKKGDTRVMVGDIVDVTLHQGEGMNEFKRRIRLAMKSIYRDGPADGVFVHDLARALWGRKGGFSTTEWMDAAREIMLEYKGLTGNKTVPQDEALK
ncbi:MAG: hypothetical protein ABIG11_10955 [bacterium]